MKFGIEIDTHLQCNSQIDTFDNAIESRKVEIESRKVEIESKKS